MRPPRIVLASTSVYRRQLLSRLGLEFHCVAPTTDERVQAGESADALVRRLARSKAASVRSKFTDTLIIGSDQVAVLDGRILGKPGSRKRNIADLRQCAGRRVVFLTGLCVLDTRVGRDTTTVARVTVSFRDLSAAQITAYVDAERAYDCAGGFRCEGLGIGLFTSIESDDPTALIGLPMISLIEMLYGCGLDVLLEPSGIEPEI